MKPVAFDRTNQELRSARFYFADKGEAVVKISWEVGVKRGKRVAADQHLATIKWRTSEPEEIRAPRACQGIVERTNRQIPYDLLRRESVFLLALERAQGP